MLRVTLGKIGRTKMVLKLNLWNEILNLSRFLRHEYVMMFCGVIIQYQIWRIHWCVMGTACIIDHVKNECSIKSIMYIFSRIAVPVSVFIWISPWVVCAWLLNKPSIKFTGVWKMYFFRTCEIQKFEYISVANTNTSIAGKLCYVQHHIIAWRIAVPVSVFI